MALPKFFSIYGQPVKVSENPYHVVVLDMKTGNWTRNEEIALEYYRAGVDVDEFSEAEFNARVAEVRKQIGKVMPEASDLPKKEK